MHFGSSRREATALISGITGQDGSYLAEVLLSRGTRVVGLTRDPEEKLGGNLEHLKDRIEVRYCAYTEPAIREMLEQYRPDSVYNLAGQTYVAKSWELIDETIQHSAMLPVRFLKTIEKVNRDIRFFQASSSEIFGVGNGQKFNESSPLSPTNPYGVAKAFAHQMVVNFRKQFGLFAINGILFNHESPRRHPSFLSRKVVQGAVKIKMGLAKELVLGNLHVSRDWGFAREYMEGGVAMMNHDEPVDFVLATGSAHTVEQLVEKTFSLLDLDWKKYVKVDSAMSRSYDAERVVGDPSLAEKELGWKPSVKLDQLLELMISAEIKLQENEKGA